ncbi:dipeptidase [Nakamurella sp. GG22]
MTDAEITESTTDRVAHVLDRSPVIDGHNDLAWALRQQVMYDLSQRDIAVHQPTLQTDIPRLRAGGVGAQFFSVYVPGTLEAGRAVTATLEQIDCVQRILAAYPDTFEAARTAGDVRRITSDGGIAALLGAEGGHSIDCSLGALRVLRRLGVAYMTLTHNQNVPWADAATDTPAVGGLTDFGTEVVREMNRIGMLVDLSHVAPTTMHAALDVSRAPVIFSHSSCRAVTEHVRNAPDAVLERLAGNGGVVMITFVADFVSQACADHSAADDAERHALGLDKVTNYTESSGEDHEPEAAAALADWRRRNPAPTATLGQVADHVEHARDVAGAAHIGLGGDFDGTDSLPAGLQDVSTYPALLAELADRGWSDDDLMALTGGNILRVLQAAEDVADPGFGA